MLTISVAIRLLLIGVVSSLVNTQLSILLLIEHTDAT